MIFSAGAQNTCSLTHSYFSHFFSNLLASMPISIFIGKHKNTAIFIMHLCINKNELQASGYTLHMKQH